MYPESPLSQHSAVADNGRAVEGVCSCHKDQTLAERTVPHTPISRFVVLLLLGWIHRWIDGRGLGCEALISGPVVLWISWRLVLVEMNVAWVVWLLIRGVVVLLMLGLIVRSA
jgi:hypothetical protein